MQNELILNRIENLRGRKPYEEKKATKLGFASLYEYFEDKIAKEAEALEADQASKSIPKKAKILFSPVIGTISEAILTATKSKY